MKTESRHNTEVKTFIAPLTGRLLTIFSSNTPNLISLPLCVAGDICSARLRPLRPVFCRFQFLLCAVCSTVAKVTPDKDWTGDANALGCRGKGVEKDGDRLLRERSRPTSKLGHRVAKLISALAGFAQVRTKGACQATAASKPMSHEFRHEK